MVGLKSRPLLRRLVKAILLAQDGVLTMTLGSRTELIQAGLDPRRVVSFRYWVDLENFRPGTKTESKATLGLKGRFIVLFVGRLIEEKGVALFIDIARRLNEEEENSNLLFVMVGDGPLRPYVEKSGKSLKNFHLAGRVRNTQMPLYYRAADILVVPSTRAEGFPRVILEALSCGTPVIGSNCGGIPEATDPSVALVVEPDLPNFVNAVRRLYHDTTTLEKMNTKARDFAEINFSKRNADTIENVLNGDNGIWSNRAPLKRDSGEVD
jgi:glycosyltransferase involved in cell wall biosynthesis